jgi:protein adenylyltransferase
MAKNAADFTNTFHRLCDAARDAAADADVRSQFTDPAAFDEWAARWRQRLADEPQSAEERRAAMRAVNPAFIPRNHRIEAVIAAAVNNDDYAPFEALLTVLARPYEDQPQFAAYADPPLPDQRVLQTFCGT